MRANPATYREATRRRKKTLAETLLATSLFFMLIWVGGLAFLHVAGPSMHWLPFFAVISLVLYLLTSIDAA